MKRISFRVAVAAAAVAAMAALTAGPASAGTVLCQTQTDTCAQENIKPAGSSFVTANPSWHVEHEDKGLRVKSGLMELHCSEELMSVKSTMRNGNPLPGTLSSSIAASGCTQKWLPDTQCTDVTMDSPLTMLEATEAGRSIKFGSESEPLSVSFACDFDGEVEETCVFEATDTVTMALDEGNATIEGAPLTRTAGESPGCTAFSQGSPITLWVENIEGGVSYLSQATETVLCGELGVDADPCPNTEILPPGALLLTGAYNEYLHSLVIKEAGAGKSHECTNFGLGFDTTEDAGQPLEAEGSYGAVGGSSCTGLRFGERSCSSATVNTPDALIEAIGEGKATVEVGTGAQPLVLSITCEAYELNPVCKYEATGPVTMEVDTTEFTVVIDEAPLKRAEGLSLFCGPETGMVLDMTAGYNHSQVEITSI